MHLRLAHPNDITAMLAVYTPFILGTTVTFETTVPDVSTYLDRYEAIRHDFPYLVAEEEGTVLGFAYAHRFGERAAFDWSAESSIYLAPEAQGKGAGRALYTALEALLALQGYHNLYALVTWPYEASEQFHEHMGYEKQGRLPQVGWKFGAPVGLTYYHKALPTENSGHEAPLPFCKLPSETVEFILQNV